ncbi:MAG: hypothetical protein WCJ45_01970 [bacterium]
MENTSPVSAVDQVTKNVDCRPTHHQVFVPVNPLMVTITQVNASLPVKLRVTSVHDFA